MVGHGQGPGRASIFLSPLSHSWPLVPGSDTAVSLGFGPRGDAAPYQVVSSGNTGSTGSLLPTQSPQDKAPEWGPGSSALSPSTPPFPLSLSFLLTPTAGAGLGLTLWVPLPSRVASPFSLPGEPHSP